MTKYTPEHKEQIRVFIECEYNQQKLFSSYYHIKDEPEGEFILKANNARPAIKALLDHVEKQATAIEVMRGFVEEVTLANGKYKHLDGQRIVGHAYRTLSQANEILNGGE